MRRTDGLRGPGRTLLVVAALALGGGPAAAQDDDLVTLKVLSPDLALKAARGALESCRASGYQAAVAVVDRFGVLQVLLRDRYAGPHTVETARRKAWSAASFRTDTGELSEIAQPGEEQYGLRQIPQALPLGGGVKIEAAGSLLGGIGVSGAPGGTADEGCARDGVEAIEDALLF